MNSLTPEFYSILVRSLGVTFLQAGLGAVLATGVGVTMAFLSYFSSPKSHNLFGDLLHRFLFSMPGVTMAFCTILVFESTGLFPIVFCHFIFSVGWVFTESRQKILSAMGGSRFDSIQLASSFGAGFLEQILRGPLRSLWTQLFVEKASILFFTFINAFSVVLILGGGPQYSTLEVLNFHYILSGESGQRLWVVGITQIILALVGAFLLSLVVKKDSKELHSQHLLKSRVLYSQLLGFKTKPMSLGQSVFKGFVYSWMGVVIFRLWGDLANMNYKSQDLLDALQSSGLLVGIAVGLYFAVSAMLMIWPVSFNRFSKYFMLSLSPTLVSMVGYFCLKDLNWDSHFKTALVLILGWLPWMLYVLSESWSQIPWSQMDLSVSFGASKSQIMMKHFKAYFFQGWFNLLVFVLLATASDVFVSPFFLEEQETLVMLGRRWAQRYQFEGMSLVVAIQSLFAFALVGGKELYESRV
jgi:hypothetical protein